MNRGWTAPPSDLSLRVASMLQLSLAAAIVCWIATRLTAASPELLKRINTTLHVSRRHAEQDGRTDRRSKVSFLRLRAQGEDWFGPPFVSLVCEIPATGNYAVSIEAVKGPEEARVQLFQNEVAVGPAVDLYSPERTRSKLMALGTLSLENGPSNLMFKLVGKNERSRGLGFDLITIQCEKVPRS